MSQVTLLRNSWANLIYLLDITSNTQIFRGPHGPPEGGAAGGAQAQQAVQNAQNAEIAFQFKVHVTKKAQQWLQTQAQAVQNNYQQLQQAFIGRYINGDPQIMLESQLHNLKLLGTDVEIHVNSLLEIGRKLNLWICESDVKSNLVKSDYPDNPFELPAFKELL